jgi:hypothetical protein
MTPKYALAAATAAQHEHQVKISILSKVSHALAFCVAFLLRHRQAVCTVLMVLAAFVFPPAVPFVQALFGVMCFSGVGTAAVTKCIPKMLSNPPTSWVGIIQDAVEECKKEADTQAYGTVGVRLAAIVLFAIGAMFCSIGRSKTHVAVALLIMAVLYGLPEALAAREEKRNEQGTSTSASQANRHRARMVVMLVGATRGLAPIIWLTQMPCYHEGWLAIGWRDALIVSCCVASVVLTSAKLVSRVPMPAGATYLNVARGAALTSSLRGLAAFPIAFLELGSLHTTLQHICVAAAAFTAIELLQSSEFVYVAASEASAPSTSTWSDYQRWIRSAAAFLYPVVDGALLTPSHFCAVIVCRVLVQVAIALAVATSCASWMVTCAALGVMAWEVSGDALMLGRIFGWTGEPPSAPDRVQYCFVRPRVV